MIIASSLKQKINTCSSTETELVATDDCLPNLLWVNNFFQAQDMHVNNTKLFQNNQSTILLEKNSRPLGLKCTRHINIWYYFITGQITKRELNVEFCPTNKMIVDFFTKPLQGVTFLKLCNAILNCPSCPSHLHCRSVLEITMFLCSVLLHPSPSLQMLSTKCSHCTHELVRCFHW